jgi:hypothetical protein
VYYTTSRGSSHLLAMLRVNHDGCGGDEALALSNFMACADMFAQLTFGRAVVVQNSRNRLATK